MPVKQEFEALSKCDWFEECFGKQPEDAGATVLLRQQAVQCIRLLRKELGLSHDGAVYEVRKFLKLEPLRYCASPIEKQLMAAFLGVDWCPFMTIPPTVCRPGEFWKEGHLIIAPQFEFGGRFLDFLLIGKDDTGDQKWVNVECDGEEYHHTTMDQRDCDRERNKFMPESGIEVIRFRGRDIFKQPAACAHEAATTLINWRQRDQQDRKKLSCPTRDFKIGFNFDPPR
jgi:very-short-patch-repair endonuclease